MCISYYQDLVQLVKWNCRWKFTPNLLRCNCCKSKWMQLSLWKYCLIPREEFRGVCLVPLFTLCKLRMLVPSPADISSMAAHHIVPVLKQAKLSRHAFCFELHWLLWRPRPHKCTPVSCCLKYQSWDNRDIRGSRDGTGKHYGQGSSQRSLCAPRGTQHKVHRGSLFLGPCQEI